MEDEGGGKAFVTRNLDGDSQLFLIGWIGEALREFEEGSRLGL